MSRKKERRKSPAPPPADDSWKTWAILGLAALGIGTIIFFSIRTQKSADLVYYQDACRQQVERFILPALVAYNQDFGTLPDSLDSMVKYLDPDAKPVSGTREEKSPSPSSTTGPIPTAAATAIPNLRDYLACPAEKDRAKISYNYHRPGKDAPSTYVVLSCSIHSKEMVVTLADLRAGEKPAP